MNWTLIGILLIVGAIILWIINQITYPLSMFSPWSEWIKNNPSLANCATTGGVILEPVTCIPETQLAFYMFGDRFFYNIGTLFSQEKDILEEFQIDFVILIMRSFAKDIVPGGMLTPKGLCCNIVPYPIYGTKFNNCSMVDPPDNVGSTWQGAKLPDDTSLSLLMINEFFKGKEIPARYPGDQAVIDDKNLPFPSTIANWVTFMVAVWGIRPICSADKKTAISVCAQFDCTTVDGKKSHYGGWTAPSNFLWHNYGIGPTSPLVVSFCLGNWNDTSGIKLNSFALAHLLGCHDHTTRGGWIGLARAFSGNTYGVDDIISYVWARYVQPQSLVDAQNTSSKKSCNVGSVATAGVSGAIGIVGIAAMLLGPLGWATSSVLWTCAAAGVVGGATNGLLSASSQHCFNKTENLTLEDNKLEDDNTDKCSTNTAFPGFCCPTKQSSDPTNPDCSGSCKSSQTKMNDNWYDGVVGIDFNTTIPPWNTCLLSKNEMQAWCTPLSKNYNKENCELLNKITCNTGTGIKCSDNADQYTFGSYKIVNGELLNTKTDKNGNCIYHVKGISPVNVGLPNSDGKCTRNIFYCNGHGTCDQNTGKCTCDDDYTKNDSTSINVCMKKDALRNNHKCVFGSGVQKGKCGKVKTDWSNDQFNGNNCGPKNNTGWCDIKHFCKDGLTEKQAKNMCTYNNASDQKTECKSTKDGGTQIGLPGCNNTDNVCCWQNGNVVGCQTENDKPTDPPGTRRGKDKDGNEFLQYFTGQWNNHGVWPFQTTVCSYSPYKEQALALGPG